MVVVDTKDIDFDPVFVQRLKQHLSRLDKKPGRKRTKFTVTDGGTRFDHRLGAYPVHITIMPLSEMTVWHYKEPDSTSLYLKASADGEVLISVSGE